jgi:hypothetical protein
MATFTDILREQRKSGQNLGSSIKTAFGERAKERLDPRNYLFKKKGLVTALFPGLKGYQSKTGAEKIKEGKSGGLSGEGAEVILNSMNSNLSFMKSQFKIVAKNSIVLPQMARDTNITKQNIAKLLKSLGEKPTYGTDMFFKNAAKRESQYKSGTKEKTPKASKVVSAAPEAATGIRSIIQSVGMSFRTMISGVGNGLKVFGNFLKQSVIGLARLAVLFAPEGALVLGLIALGITIANLVSRWKDWNPYQDAKNAAKNALGIPNTIINTDPPANNRVDGKVDGKKYGPRGELLPDANPPANPPKNGEGFQKSNLPGLQKDLTAKLKEGEVGALNSTLDKDKLYTVSGSNRTITSTELEKRRKGESLINDRGGINFRALGNNIGDFLGFDSSKKSTNIRGIEGTIPKPQSSAPIKVEPQTAVEPRDNKAYRVKPGQDKYPHSEGIEALARVAFSSRVSNSNMNQISAYNDEYHQDKGGMHPMGLASDISLDGNYPPSQEGADWDKAREDAANIIELAQDAGLNFTLVPSKVSKNSMGLYYNPGEHDGYVRIETKELSGATGPHIHTEFANRKVADKYAKYAENMYPDLVVPLSSKAKPTAVRTTTPAAKTAPDAKASTASAPASTAPMNASDIAKQKRTEYLNQLNKELNEGKPPGQQFIIDNSDKRSSITNNGGGDSGGALAAADVFDTALEWYFRQQLA